MRTTMIKGAILSVMLAACDQSSSGPGSPGARWPLPSFSIQPGAAVAESTGCDRSVAYAFSPHLDAASTATFYPPNSSTARGQCGDLLFTEDAASPGRVVMYERLTVGNPTTAYQAWGRRTRLVTSGDATEVFDTARVLGGGWVTLPNGTNHYFDAPANSQYDIVAFAYRHDPTSAVVTSPSGQVNAKAQVWRQIPAPTNLAVTVLDGRRARITWANHFLNRLVDSTEVWRSSSLWQRVAGVSPDSQGYTDSVPAAGVYHYSVRHVGDFVLYTDDDVGGMSRPNSPAPADTTVTLGAAAPTNLQCAGTLIPTIPCTWTNTVPGDSVAVYRGAQVLRRLASVTAWTDSSVTLNQTYIYQVAHIDAGYIGLITNPDTVVATASAPLQLGCSGLKDQAKVFCSWYNTESADTLQLQRSTSSAFNHNVVAYRLLPATGGVNDTTGLTIGTTYYYRIQYVRGTRASAWSNTDTAVPGTPDPIRPPP